MTNRDTCKERLVRSTLPVAHVPTRRVRTVTPTGQVLRDPKRLRAEPADEALTDESAGRLHP
jgi:hypothetical protein